jgi:hypothetical protein
LSGQNNNHQQGGFMKKIVASVLIAAFIATGCTGSFNLTRKVYNFHRSQSDKWADELCFLLVALIPVYSLATLADAIVFNSIEFWSGKNPVEMASANGKDKVRMSYNSQTGQVHVASNGNHGIIFERSNTAVTAKNEQGQVLYSSVQNDKGDVAIYDGKGNLIKEYPSGQIALLKEKYLQSKQQ